MRLQRGEVKHTKTPDLRRKFTDGQSYMMHIKLPIEPSKEGGI